MAWFLSALCSAKDACVLLAFCLRCARVVVEKFLLYSVLCVITIFFPLHDILPFCMFFLPFAYFRRFRIPRFLEYPTIFQSIFLSHQNHRKCWRHTSEGDFPRRNGFALLVLFEIDLGLAHPCSSGSTMLSKSENCWTYVMATYVC